DHLLTAGHDVTYRTHPMTIRHQPDFNDNLRKHFNENRRFHLDSDITSQDSFHLSDLMISDWSGVALEYAFALERPVLFIDTPRKTNNPEHEKLNCPRLEVEIRNQIGQVVSPSQLERVPEVVNSLCSNFDLFSNRISKLRSETVYSV